MATKWSVQAAEEHLSEREKSCDHYGGFLAYTAEELVQRVNGRKVVSQGAKVEAIEILKTRQGWLRAKMGTWLYRAKSGKPDQVYLRHFEDRFRHYSSEKLGRGPITLRDIDAPWGMNPAPPSQFLAEWGRELLEAEEWRAAICPEGVHALDVAWYPPIDPTVDRKGGLES